MDMLQLNRKFPKKALLYSVVLIIALMTVLMSILQPFKEIEYFAEDFIYQNASAIPSEIKIIAIDELTLDKLGPYSSWDRTLFADLLEILNSDENHRPSVISLDVIFSGSDNSQNDERLVKEAGKYQNVLVASKLELANRVEKQGDTYYNQTYVVSEIGAYDELSDACVSGFTTPIFDEDGYTRKAYGRLVSDGAEYYGFAMRTAQMAGYTGETPAVYEFTYSGKPGEFEAIPMSMVLDGTVPSSYFADSIVLVGAYEEGLMDSYSVPIDHSNNMYGVEIQANEIAALLYNRISHRLPMALTILLSLIFLIGAGFLMSRTGIKKGAIILAISLILHIALCLLVFAATRYIIPVLYIPFALVFLFIVIVLVKHAISQHERAEDMQKMLFSMADSMAEAIEGRTPYNANHTKNVAKRCIEMLDYINELHAQKKTDLHFTEKDRRQLYLAAMLHDIGKMDVPLEVMDKPTRLGDKIKALTDRLSIIKYRLLVDKLEQTKASDYVDSQIADIEQFIASLGSFDSGRPLKEDEIAFIDDFGSREYTAPDNSVIPYLTEDELDDLHIKAGTLSDREREMMKSHVVFTDRILSHVYFGHEFDNVKTMAADHHELLNGSGYPNSKESKDLSPMTRILTIMDIYDSLIADDRPYKKPKTVEVAFKILDEEAQAGKVDASLVQIAKALYLGQ
ncbi:MAG: CHASE2 domain-containing protein [Lachnospiraceae bacterium]|nr:CHASE2 domain-containing protein [Candidatus Merdinaster equi]